MSVQQEVRGPALWLTIDRERARNALDPATLDGIGRGLARAAEDGDIRAVVLTGAGQRVFCAGADLKAMAAASTPYARSQAQQAYCDLLLALVKSPVPVISRIDGDVLAGGMGLVLASHLAVARPGVRFSLPEVNVGLFPMMVTGLLLRQVGQKQATRLLLTGDKVGAEDALALGLLSHLSAEGELDQRVDALCQTLARKAPVALALGLDAIRQAPEMGLEQSLTFLRGQLGVVSQTEDAMEGIMAFMSKRAPVWKGR